MTKNNGPNNGPSRKKRLESLLHREIATVVQQELRDPRLGFITIMRVELSDDLHQVTAYWTMLDEKQGRRMAAQALEQARGYVQRSYAPVVKTRMLPTLTFAYDDSEERRQGMDELIRRARKTDSDLGERPEPTIVPPSQLPPTPPAAPLITPLPPTEGPPGDPA
jgi:ribosome-binding factor A